jgi:hypothetical protein
MRTLLFAIALAAAFSTTACSVRDEEISRSIAYHIDSRSSAPFSLQSLVRADWQRVCIVAPYATNESFEKVVGFKWNVQRHSSIGGNDGISLLVFIRGQEVVAFTEHPRGKGDFTRVIPPCVEREKAIIVNQGSTIRWSYIAG